MLISVCQRKQWHHSRYLKIISQRMQKYTPKGSILWWTHFFPCSKTWKEPFASLTTPSSTHGSPGVDGFEVVTGVTSSKGLSLLIFAVVCHLVGFTLCRAPSPQQALIGERGFLRGTAPYRIDLSIARRAD